MKWIVDSIVTLISEFVTSKSITFFTWLLRNIWGVFRSFQTSKGELFANGILTFSGGIEIKHLTKMGLKPSGMSYIVKRVSIVYFKQFSDRRDWFMKTIQLV